MYEFVKYGKNYLVKNSNGRIVSEKEKIQMVMMQQHLNIKLHQE